MKIRSCFYGFFLVGPWMRFVGWKETTPGFSPHLRHARSLRRAGTSISDRTRSYAADTSHDKHSGCVMGGLTKGSPGANQREVPVDFFRDPAARKPPFGCLKPCKQQRMFTISTGELAGVLNHQQVYMELEVSSKNPPCRIGSYLRTSWWLPFQFSNSAGDLFGMVVDVSIFKRFCLEDHPNGCKWLGWAPYL